MQSVSAPCDSRADVYVRLEFTKILRLINTWWNDKIQTKTCLISRLGSIEITQIQNWNKKILFIGFIINTFFPLPHVCPSWLAPRNESCIYAASVQMYIEIFLSKYKFRKYTVWGTHRKKKYVDTVIISVWIVQLKKSSFQRTYKSTRELQG